MHPRIRALAMAAAAVVLSSADPPAAGYEYLDGAHWDVAPVGGGPGPVLILDGTEDPRAQEALRSFKAEWNAMRALPSLAALPPVELAIGSASEACSGSGLRGASAPPAHVVVCLDDALATAAVGGPYLVDAQGHTTLGLVKLRTTTLAWTPCNLRTAMAHELGHVMGLAHNDREGFTGGPSVMMSGKAPYGRGCPAWFNAHDRDALRALYEGHAASCSLHAQGGISLRSPRRATATGAPRARVAAHVVPVARTLFSRS